MRKLTLLGVLITALWACGDTGTSDPRNDPGGHGGTAGITGFGGTAGSGGTAGMSGAVGEAGSGGMAGGAVADPPAGCWQLEPVNRIRFVPGPGQAASMVGGKIQGSNDSPTNGFVDLVTISSTPSDSPAYTELGFSNTTPYRYVKYWGPPGSYGQVAEIEFYSDTTRLAGSGFGTSGSRSENPWPNALDGSTSSFFDGPLANDIYVGIDAASEHLVGLPRFSPPGDSYASPQAVTITSSTAGAVIRYTTDGSDPATNGITYAGPVSVSRTMTLRAIATKSCMFGDTAMGVYQIGTPSSTVQASIHIGNSLTDTINDALAPLATSGGYTLDYWRYTVPGIGTWIYEDSPTGGIGLEGAPTQNIQTYLQTKAFDHISFQPASNMPCIPTGHAGDSPAINKSDSVNIALAWDHAVTMNPNVQMWVYNTWDSGADYINCMTGEWNRDPAIWNPSPATSWENSVDLQHEFGEAVRAGLVAHAPTRPPPYIIPAGLALKALKVAIEAGDIPDMATDSFWTRTFQAGFGTDDHLTSDGRYFVSLVFYAAMFQQSPAGLPHANTTLTDEQAAAFQQIAWNAVANYPLSGIGR